MASVVQSAWNGSVGLRDGNGAHFVACPAPSKSSKSVL